MPKIFLQSTENEMCNKLFITTYKQCIKTTNMETCLKKTCEQFKCDGIKKYVKSNKELPTIPKMAYK